MRSTSHFAKEQFLPAAESTLFRVGMASGRRPAYIVQSQLAAVIARSEATKQSSVRT
jgi:hypothetical protein